MKEKRNPVVRFYITITPDIHNLVKDLMSKNATEGNYFRHVEPKKGFKENTEKKPNQSIIPVMDFSYS